MTKRTGPALHALVTRGRLAGLWTLGALLMTAGPTAAQQFITEPEASVSLAQGTSVVLVGEFSRVAIADPEVAEAVVVTPNEVLINGLGLGTTTFVAWDTIGNPPDVRRRGHR